MDIHVCTVYKYLTHQMLINRRSLAPYVSSFIEVGPVFFGRGSRPENMVRGGDWEQCWARNMYVNQVPEGDYMLVLDADELIWGDFTDLQNVFSPIHTVKEAVNGVYTHRPRLIQKTAGMSYIRHDLLIDEELNEYDLSLSKGARHPLINVFFINMQDQIKLEEASQMLNHDSKHAYWAQFDVLRRVSQ